MSEFLQEIEAEFMRIRGRRGLLKPLDWDLAAKWEKAGFPLHVVTRTMSEIAAKFYRENRDRDEINSLRYFDSAVRKNVAEFQARQVGKFEEEKPPSELFDVDINDTLEKLESAVKDLYVRLPKLNHEILAATFIIRELRTSNTMNEQAIESRLQELDRELILTLRSMATKEQNETFDAAGTSSDPYLHQAQISAAIRAHFSAPELTVFPDL